MASFNTMPNEVIATIFRHLLTVPPSLPSTHCIAHHDEDDSSQLIFPTGILTINRKIHEIASKVFYRENTFYIKVNSKQLKRREIPLPCNKLTGDPILSQSFCNHAKHIRLDMNFLYIRPHGDEGKIRTNGHSTPLITQLSGICQLLWKMPGLQTVHVKMIIIPEGKKWYTIKKPANKLFSELMAPVRSLPLGVNIRIETRAVENIPAHWVGVIMRSLFEIGKNRHMQRTGEVLEQRVLNEYEQRQALQQSHTVRCWCMTEKGFAPLGAEPTLDAENVRRGLGG
ncbi:MAG: hypothetical protein Q9217_001918 [Psora testacea]